MEIINFCGIKGQVIETSPHGNYKVVQLSRRVAICGTISNSFNWEESPDNNSGFISFIAYFGLRSAYEKQELEEKIADKGGYLKNSEGIRKAKRVKAYPFEIKVRGLSPESLVDLIKKE